MKNITPRGDAAVFQVYIFHLRQQHGQVWAVLQDRTDRLRDIGCGKPCGRYLVKKWLEQVVIRPVDDRHMRVGSREVFAERQSAKTCAQNKYFHPIVTHPETVSHMRGCVKGEGSERSSLPSKTVTI